MTKPVYVLDTRTSADGLALWWRPDRAGYTVKIEEAGVYDGETFHSPRDTDVLVPVETARSLSVQVVPTWALLQNGISPPKAKAIHRLRCASCHRFVGKSRFLCQRCLDREHESFGGAP